MIGSDLLPRLSELIEWKEYSGVAIISDEQVVRFWGANLASALGGGGRLVVVPPGETSKCMGMVQHIWSELLAMGCDRKSLVLNLGGGMIGDLGGFAASTYMRGIDFVQIPTSLLSQVDASVGGKVGINACGIKNLAGVFQQPLAVIIDVDTLTTLPKREMRSGLAEVVKHGLIRDAPYLERICARSWEACGSSAWEEIILRSCEIKAEVVRADEREGGLRKILNFGHTVGHALEALFYQRGAGAEMLHGEAVAYGMFCEARLSHRVGLLSGSELDDIEDILRDLGLLVSMRGVSWTEILPLLKSDKKNIGGRVRWTLLRRIGEAVFDVELEDLLIEQTLRECFP